MYNYTFYSTRANLRAGGAGQAAENGGEPSTSGSDGAECGVVECRARRVVGAHKSKQSAVLAPLKVRGAKWPSQIFPQRKPRALPQIFRHSLFPAH